MNYQFYVEHAYFRRKTTLPQQKQQYYCRGVASKVLFATPLTTNNISFATLGFSWARNIAVLNIFAYFNVFKFSKIDSLVPVGRHREALEHQVLDKL